MRKVAIVALSAMLLAAAGTAALARPAATLDFGDAPDRAPAAYGAKPSLVATFPSKAASGGPRHTAAGPRIGRGWSGEGGSRQVDRDADDGAGLVPRSCAVSTLTVIVDASRADPGAPIYVNAWFDWNEDGDWAEGGTRTCGPEWGVQNRRIDPATLGASRIGVVAIRFRAGKVPAQFWWRVQVHQGATVPHRAGGGQPVATRGETEDWLYGRPRKTVQLSCRTGLLSIFTHGGSTDVDFALGGISGHDVRVLNVAHAGRGDLDGIALTRTDPVPNVWRVRVKSTKKHARDNPVQSVQVDLEVQALVDETVRTYKRTCGVAVAHTQRIVPPYEPPRNTKPAITVPSVGVAINPDKPTPQSARCAASVSDGLAYFRVLTVCRGVDIKSTSTWYSTEPVHAWNGSREDWPRTLLNRCDERFTGTNALKCYWKGGNKGRVLDLRVETPTGGRTRIQIVVLAGGHGEGGTAIVFQQTWYALGGGEFRCLQTVPRAESCILAGSP
ncbi:MAG: hypothetical protein ACRDNB_09030 [Gaiellaceae bacterium]